MGLYFFTKPYTSEPNVAVDALGGNTTSGHPEEHAVDYKKTTYWENDAATPELKISLGEVFAVDSLWFKSDNVAKYKLYYDSGGGWVQIGTEQNGNADGINSLLAFGAQSAQYWKLSITQKTAPAQKVKIYEVLLMEQRLAITTITNAPADIDIIPTDRAGSGYKMASGAMTTYSGERIFHDVQLTFEYTPKANRDNLYDLFCCPTFRPPLTIWPDSVDHPEDICRVVWADNKFGLQYQIAFKGSGFGGVLRFQEY